MHKQKAAAINDCGIKPNKVRKIETPILSQTQGLSQIQTNYQSMSQSINFAQTIDDPVANNDLDRLMEIWNHARKDQLLSINDNQEQFKELEKHLAVCDSQVEELENSLRKVDENNLTMTKYIESEVTMQNEIIIKQNVSLYLMSVVQEHTDVITDTLRDCEENRQNLLELYDRTSLEQERNMKKLIEEFNNLGIRKQKESVEHFELKNSELISAQTRCQQYNTEIAKISQEILEVNVAVEEGEKMNNENQIKYEEEIRKMSDGVKKSEEYITVERQENFKLAAEAEKRSKQLEDLFSQEKALQVTSAQSGEQIEYLKSSLREAKEEEKNLVNNIAELNSEHLALISNKDLKLEDYRKQLEDLRLAQTETANKLSEAISNNTELSQIVTEKLRNIEQLKNSLRDKDDETVELNAELTRALEKQKELYSTIENVKERLISQDNEIERIKADSDSSSTKDKEGAKRICEMRSRLATMQIILEDKCREKTNFIEKAKKNRIELANQVKHYEQEISNKDRQINELMKTKEDIRKKKDRKKSEHNKKMQEMKRFLEHCELAEHEKQIDEQNAKIDALTREVATENRKLEEINLEKSERDKQKALEKIELKEKETMFASLKERCSVIEETNKDLNKKWKDVQTLNEAESARKSLSANLSPLLGRSYRKTMSIPATSTPNQSASINHRQQLDSGSFASDLSSINASTPFGDGKYGFDMLVQSNQTDAAKLSEPEAKEKLQTSPMLWNVTARAKNNKFFKRYGVKK